MRKESNITMTWLTCCWRIRSHPLLLCTTGIYRRWTHQTFVLYFCLLTGSNSADTKTVSHSDCSGLTGEIRRLAERQHGEPLQRLRQLMLWEIWKQGEVLDHLQQPVGTSVRREMLRSQSCEKMWCLVCVSVSAVALCFQSVAVEGYETGEHAPGLKLKGTGAYKAAHHIIKVRLKRRWFVSRLVLFCHQTTDNTGNRVHSFTAGVGHMISRWACIKI